MVGSRPAGAGDAAFPPVGTYPAVDTLRIGEESSEDARACLEGLKWAGAKFDVECRASGEEACDAVVTYPSPLPSGREQNDRVVLEWYAARDAEGRPMRAPAIIVVHESGSRMTVGRLVAQGLRPHGVHAFLIHLPHYGQRREGATRPDGKVFLTLIRQAIADVRRARDAVAVLPLVDPGHIALQGTSLGGIVSATTAGLDDGYDSVFLLLAGGDLHDLLEHGQRDAAKFRMELARAGVTGEKLIEITRHVEPTRLAHRVDPERVWLFTAEYDQVVPKRNADRLASTMRLTPTHHVRLKADHYTGVVYLPFLLQQMARHVRTAAGRPMAAAEMP